MIEIIGEMGVCHNGNLDTAKQLADAAKTAGCDMVKTQLFDVERVYAPDKWKEMKAVELSRDDVAKLKEHCDSIGIEFLCTPDEIEDARFLSGIGVKRIKTSSQDVTNIPFLRQIAKLGLPIIMSTGACAQEEMDRAIWTVQSEQGRSWDLTVLHCVSSYPPPISESNLRVLIYMSRSYFCRYGYSDHTLTETSALVALGLGATMFEKHFTLDRKQRGPDHGMSMEPKELRAYVNKLRIAELSMGDGIKKIMPCEVQNRKRYDEFIAPRLKHVDVA
jgi:N,N'-diacetyllegionaminate synthase